MAGGIEVRGVRVVVADSADECYLNEASYDPLQAQRQAQRNAVPAVWPYGLAANLVVGAAFTAVAVRRLTTPSRRLPRGTRVA